MEENPGKIPVEDFHNLLMLQSEESVVFPASLNEYSMLIILFECFFSFALSLKIKRKSFHLKVSFVFF